MKVTATTNMFVLGAASGGGVQWGTIIVTIATFAILLLLLKKFAWGPLKEVMDNVNAISIKISTMLNKLN